MAINAAPLSPALSPVSEHSTPSKSPAPPTPPSILVHLRFPLPRDRTPRAQVPPPAPQHRPMPANSHRPAKNRTDLVPILGTPSFFGPPHDTSTVPAPTVPTGASVLTVNECWAVPILMGLKTWEVRTTNTLKRGTIYIAVSGLSEIWGEVTLTDTHRPSAPEWARSSLKHIIARRSDPSAPTPPLAPQCWAWHLTDARLYDSPYLQSTRPTGAEPPTDHRSTQTLDESNDLVRTVRDRDPHPVRQRPRHRTRGGRLHRILPRQGNRGEVASLPWLLDDSPTLRR